MVELTAVVFPVTRSSSLSVEDHTVRCVVESEPTSMGYQRSSQGYNGGQTTIDSAYVSGVALMYGSPRQHIWTFANGAWENQETHGTRNCPCDSYYRCGINPTICWRRILMGVWMCSWYYSGVPRYTLHSNDTLWDGRDCHSTSTCCSLHNPPYFTKTLNHTTTDDLELRMCLRDPGTYDNLAVELVELYVK